MENSINEQATTVENRARFFKRKVLSLHDSLVRLDASLSEVKLATFNSSELAVRLELLERAQASFDLAQNALEEIDYNEIGSETRDNFDERFLEVKSRVRAHFDSRERQLIRSSTLRRNETIDPSANGLSARANRRRLPELKLPTFGGGYTEYASFWSMFESVIDKDNDLDDVEKFQHLLSCLTGPALDAVRSLDISRLNYRVALDILDNRFNNNQLVFQSHIKDLLGTKKVETGASVATKLREFSDKVNVHMGALRTLGRPEDIANSILIYVLLQKLDVETQAAWEDSRALDNPAADKVPTATEFFTFLDERCRKLESLQYAMVIHSAGPQLGRNFSHNGSRKAFVAQASSSRANVCVFCDAPGHGIYSCPIFANLSPFLRQKEVKKLALCFNCLKKGHQTRSCTSGACRNCGGRHHSLLHFETSQRASSADASAALQPQASTSLAAQCLRSDAALLGTVGVLLKSRAGSFIHCRALLDSGSQIHMMTSHLAQQLQLKRTRSDAMISGLGDTDVSVEGCTVNVCMRSCITDYSVNFQAVVASTITNSQPNFAIDIDGWAIPSNIQLADPAFNRPQRVDLLIGASLFYGLLCDGQIDLGDGLPVLQKTRLGWIVAGGGDSRQQTALMAAEKVSDVSVEQQQCQRMGLANGVQCMSKQMDKLSCQEESQTTLPETNAVLQQMQRNYEELQQQLHDRDAEWTQRQQELEHHLRHKQDQLNAAEQQVLQLQTRIRDHEAQERIKELGKELQPLHTSTEMKERDLRDRLALFKDEVSAMLTSSQLRRPSNHSNSLNDSSGELCRLTKDMESLRCVLELKQADIPTLSKQNAELQRENDEQRRLSNRVTLLHHLYRSVGRFVLNYDELRTLICQIAAILNNHSLLSVSENPDDLDVLTPAHLLFGGPPTVILEPDLTTLDYNRLDGWQRITQLQQVFWNRWREEYVTLLQQRSKWRIPDRRLQVNDVVLVKDENLPPLRWPLARVMALIPGKDGECRVAELKATCGSTRRAINKLCLLPLKDDVER